MLHVAKVLKRAGAGLLLPLLLVAGGCRQDMRDQARLNPLAASDFFSDGSASRPLLTNTIARGHLTLDTPWFTGKTNGQFVTEFPCEVDEALLRRGQERFGIYCTPCHDRAGTGDGMIVRRGFIKPRSYHDPLLRAQPHGYYFDVITHGFGNMSDYAAQVPIADRWAIVAYIRALQVSQHATADLLQDEDRALLASGGVKPSATETGHATGAHGHHE
ncbi:MAG: cytochrome c [Verrucomicrobia bacterium]|nr:cytochrome c [Verrucomicrobiota bacterium]